MAITCLIVTASSDLPETQLFIGLHRLGVDLEIMCSPKAPYRHLLIAAGLVVTNLSLTGRFDRSGIGAIRRKLQAKSFDILHAFDNNTVSNSLVASRKHKLAFIAYRGIEGNVSYCDPASWTTYLHPRVTCIVCVAEAIRRYFHTMRFLGIPWPVKKALTIYKGHDAAWYRQPMIDLRGYGVSRDGIIVGCIVNDRPRKGLRYLIEATWQLPMNVHLVLIGNITSKKLRALIAQSPLCRQIHLLGYQCQATRFIRACDICILPASKREGLPKGIIEGMIQGVAPIVTDTGGSPELIEHGVSGLIIPARSSQAIAAAIVQLTENSELLEKIKRNAPKRINDYFHIETTIARHYQLYKTLVVK